MNLRPGDLYFIRELDVLNGQASNYCKVGLVKESRRGDADTRADEHQTGNPRKLTVVRQVHAPAISDLEASVHDRFATLRILGEWFDLPDPALERVATEAQRLADEQNQHLDVLVRADDAKINVSSPNILDPDAEDLIWHQQALVASALKKRVETLRKQSVGAFKTATDAGQDVTRFAAYTDKSVVIFAKEKFAESYPDLYESFLRTEQRLTQRFSLKTAGNSNPIPALPTDFINLESRFGDLLAQAQSGTSPLEDIHRAHLELLGFQAKATWDLELAEANLKASCGTGGGLADLCTWPRTMGETEKFDLAAFRASHPDIHDEFSQIVTRQSFAVRPMRSYP